MSNHISITDKQYRFFRYLLEYKEDWLRENDLYYFVLDSYATLHCNIAANNTYNRLVHEYERQRGKNLEEYEEQKAKESAVWDLF